MLLCQGDMLWFVCHTDEADGNPSKCQCYVMLRLPDEQVHETRPQQPSVYWRMRIHLV